MSIIVLFIAKFMDEGIRTTKHTYYY